MYTLQNLKKVLENLHINPAIPYKYSKNIYINNIKVVLWFTSKP